MSLTKHRSVYIRRSIKYITMEKQITKRDVYNRINDLIKKYESDDEVEGANDLFN